jgi:hypothetical protein
MKALKLSLFASAMLLGSFSMTAQTADEVINKHITAVGGADAWKKVTTLKMSGTSSIQGNEVKVTRTMVNKKGMRMDLEIMGANNYVIMTPTEGWQYFPVMGQTKAEAMPAEAVKESQDQLVIMDDIIKSKEAGDKFAYIAKEKVDGADCHKLTITDKDGDISTAYFDASTGYLVKISQKTEVQGQKMEVSNTFTNYKKLDGGISLPMTTSSSVEGETTWASAEVNKPVDESIFKATN